MIDGAITFHFVIPGEKKSEEKRRKRRQLRREEDKEFRDYYAVLRKSLFIQEIQRVERI